MCPLLKCDKSRKTLLFPILRLLFSWISYTIVLFFYKPYWKFQKSQLKYDTFKKLTPFKVLCLNYVGITRDFLKHFKSQKLFCQGSNKTTCKFRIYYGLLFNWVIIVAERPQYQPLNSNCA